MAESSEVQIGRRAAYLPATRTLVLADLHVGRDGASNVQLPLGERGDLIERLDALIGRFSPEEVVFAGDILHSFDSLPLEAERTLDALVETIEDAGVTPVFITGNHDRMLDTVWDGDTVAEYGLDDGETLVLHGHEPPTGDAELYVIGHDHPVLEIEGKRRPCHLYGEGVYEGSDVLVLPAFNRLAPGIVLNRTRTLGSPLVDDPGEFRPIVRDAEAGETYRFPPLVEFRSML